MKKIGAFFFLLLVTGTLFGQEDSTKRSKAEAMMLAYQLYERITKNNEGFEKIAKQYSEDPGSASVGGMYKNIAKGTFIKKVEEAIYALKPNQVSRPFRTGYGYHIVQLLSKQDDTYTFRHILIVYKGSGW